MNITILSISGKEGVNKDTAGGFGTNFNVGDSFLAGLINRAKKGIRFPSITLAYLVAIFRNNGHFVEVATNKVPDSDLVIIPSSIVDYKKEIGYAKEIKEKTNAKIGFIRPFASLRPDLYLEAGDFVIRGEPEEAAMKINENNIPRGIVESKPLPLEEVPFPDWGGFPYRDYSYHPSLKKKPFLPVLSSRGCVYNCDYCPYIIEWEWRKPRSPENVVSEMKYLISEYGIKSVMFRDPVFTLDMGRAERIADLIIKNKINLEWGCETRLDLLSIGLLDKLYKAGLRTIGVGMKHQEKSN